MDATIPTIGAVLGGYLLGSLSTAIIVCKMMKLPDPRDQGSGNPGATNVLRLGGKKAAAITLLGDVLKGLAPVFTAKMLGMEMTSLSMIALATFLGHLYPVYFSFKGGKGVATALGAFAGVSWALAGSLIVVWLIVARLTKISSVSALIAATCAPIFAWLYLSNVPFTLAISLISIMLIWRHRRNIKNLINGNEGRTPPPSL